MELMKVLEMSKYRQLFIFEVAISPWKNETWSNFEIEKNCDINKPLFFMSWRSSTQFPTLKNPKALEIGGFYCKDDIFDDLEKIRHYSINGVIHLKEAKKFIVNLLMLQ